MRKNLLNSLIFISTISGIYFSCSKGGDSGGGNPNPPPNPCAGVTVAVAATTTGTITGQSTGSIAATATGGTGFTFKLGSGAYQTSGSFSNLAAGTYTITAKNNAGCEGSASFTVATINVCNGVNISVSMAPVNATPCSNPNSGSITVTASGSTGLQYSINGTNFQAGNIFSALAAGNYTVTVKDVNGCTQTSNATVGATPAGPLFIAVRQIIQNNCVSCHSGGAAAAGRDWSVDCNVVASKDIIKTRAVDQAGTPSQMPQAPNAALSAADRQKITDWINAGGSFAN